MKQQATSDTEALRLQQSTLFEIQRCTWEKNVVWHEYHNLQQPFWRLYWNTSAGCVIMPHDGSKIEMQPGCFYLVPSYYPFSTCMISDFSQFYIHFNFTENINAVGDRIYVIPGDPFIRDYIDEYIASMDMNDNHMRCEIISYIILCHALLKCKNGPVIKKIPVNRHIFNCVKYIANHLESNLDNKRLAGIADMAINSFIRLFTEVMSESPQEYVRRKRIERACQLLSSSQLTIKEISNRLGFADQCHFSKVFKQLQYLPPSVFRKMNTGYPGNYTAE